MQLAWAACLLGSSLILLASGATSCLSQMMTLLEDDFPGSSHIWQASFESYLPSKKKIYLS